MISFPTDNGARNKSSQFKSALGVCFLPSLDSELGDQNVKFASLYARGPGACDDFAKLRTAAARPSHKRGVKPPTILQRIQPTNLPPWMARTTGRTASWTGLKTESEHQALFSRMRVTPNHPTR